MCGLDSLQTKGAAVSNSAAVVMLPQHCAHSLAAVLTAAVSSCICFECGTGHCSAGSNCCLLFFGQPHD